MQGRSARTKENGRGLEQARRKHQPEPLLVVQGVLAAQAENLPGPNEDVGRKLRLAVDSKEPPTRSEWARRNTHPDQVGVNVY